MPSGARIPRFGARCSVSPIGRRPAWRPPTRISPRSRYADAIAFFLSDLYGGADFAQRDADLARVVPVAERGCFPGA
jgi:hypothetical protein